MNDRLREWMKTAGAAYRRFADHAKEADPERLTRLAGWNVGDLVAHVTWAAAMQAEAVRSAAGLPVSDPTPGTLADAISAFEQAAGVPAEPTATVALPDGTVPLSYAAALFVFEATMHAADLETALGHGEPMWSADELSASEVVIGPMLDLVASPGPDRDVVIDLIGIGDGIRLSERNGGWHRSAPDERAATTTLVGGPRDLLLFVCGRVDTATLSLRGAREHADRFKDYFPGP